MNMNKSIEVNINSIHLPNERHNNLVNMTPRIDLHGNETPMSVVSAIFRARSGA